VGEGEVGGAEGVRRGGGMGKTSVGLRWWHAVSAGRGMQYCGPRHAGLRVEACSHCGSINASITQRSVHEEEYVGGVVGWNRGLGKNQ